MTIKGSQDTRSIQDDLANLARLSILPSEEDVRLFLAKLVRKYRQTTPDLADRLDQSLRTTNARSAGSSFLRRGFDSGSQEGNVQTTPVPIDADTRLALIRVFDDTNGLEQPLLPVSLLQQVEAVIQERQERNRLMSLGISPTKSAALIGPPGAGKTLTARWIASQLGKPLWVLDLTAVMSSFLGKSGNNLRTALDYAKSNAAVLLLDEIDAIAKRRSDETDIGELKRLVTVILQEVDLWPDTGLLLAATNHPELVDPALWRRFDILMRFETASDNAIEAAVRRFLGNDLKAMETWISTLTIALKGRSISDVERSINTLRRGKALNIAPVDELIGSIIGLNQEALNRVDRLRLAVELAKVGSLTHMQISQLTGIARDTIRKHAGPSPRLGRGMK